MKGRTMSVLETSAWFWNPKRHAWSQERKILSAIRCLFIEHTLNLPSSNRKRINAFKNYHNVVRTAISIKWISRKQRFLEVTSIVEISLSTMNEAIKKLQSLSSMTLKYVSVFVCFITLQGIASHSFIWNWEKNRTVRQHLPGKLVTVTIQMWKTHQLFLC